MDGGQWQGMWELGKPSAVHTVLSAFLISLFSESALAKFSRKPSTKYSLAIQGTSLISLSDLHKSEAWKQGNPDVSVMKWNSGGPNIFPELSIQAGDRMLLLLPVTVWGFLWLWRDWYNGQVLQPGVAFCLHLDHKTSGPRLSPGRR